MSLAATRDGFEGLIGALIETATEGAIRLMASGDQLGLDGIEDLSLIGPRRAMQAKRYRDTTTLDQSALLGEMVRAHAAIPSIDCWILPTTKQLFGKEAEALRSLAEQQGWGFIPLDWSEIAPACPRLAVLCALYPDVAVRWQQLAAVRSELDALAQSRDFDAASKNLLAELRAADVGFKSARGAATAQLNRIYSDPAAARMIAGPSPALLAQAPPVLRLSLRDAVASWWSSTEQANVLLGIEGMGKTWSALDALRTLSEYENGPLPIVIGSSRAGEARDGIVAVVAALRAIGEQAGLKLMNPEDFWRRRLAGWAVRGEGMAPKILVLVDGLDERDPFDWDGWLAPLMTEEYCDLFRILLTCREDEWHFRIGLHRPASDQLKVTPVGRFLPEERDAYLRSRHIDPAQVSDQVLEAALHPRTAFHLTRLVDEIGDLTRITREQLLLRDFQNRHQVKAGAIGPNEFEELVRRMAHTAQEAALAQQAFRVTAGEVVEAAADISGYDRGQMRSVLSDLVAGHWFTREPDNPTHLTFRDDALPDAVGLALASLLRLMPVADALREIDRFLEPWGADDLVGKVLRTCATALVTDASVADELCSAVLERWLDRPLHGSEGQDFWRRLHIFRPQVFLNICERRGDRGGSWLPEWGIASFWEDHEAVRPVIVERLSNWLTTVAVPEEMRSENRRYDRHANRARNRQLARLHILERLHPGIWKERIGRDADALPQRSAYIAGRIIGMLPRAAFADLFCNWALNCAAAGRVEHERVIETLLRDNDDDSRETLTAIRSTADAFEAAGHDLGRAAAAYLLRATGATVDAARADRLRPLPQRLTHPPTVMPVSSPEGQQLHMVRNESLQPSQMISVLWSYVGDPTVELDSELQDHLTEAAKALTTADVPDLFELDGQSASVLLRWQPEKAHEIIRSYLLAAPIPTTEPGRAGRQTFRRIALGALPYLDKADRHALADRLDASASQDGRGHGGANALRLAQAPLADQLELLLGTPHNRWPRAYRHLLNEPAGDEVVRLVEDIDFAAPADLIRPQLAIAKALIPRLESKPVTREWRGGFTHADEDIRYGAIHIAAYSGGENAARELAALGLTAGMAPDVMKAFDVSAVLTNLDDGSLALVLDRLCPENLAHTYLHRPALRADVVPHWRAWMEDCLLVDRRSRTFAGTFQRWGDRTEAYLAYCHDHPDAAAELIRSAWEDRRLRGNILWDHGDGPAWELIRGLTDSDPELVKTIWREAVDKSGSMWVSSTEYFPAELPAGEAFDDLRAEMLMHAKTDERLFDAVRRMEEHQHQPFLVRWIREGLNSDLPIDQARTLTVAGFLDASGEAVALWQGLTIQAPDRSWLAEVHEAALRWFEAARHARHWYHEMSRAPDELQALRAYSLVNRVADARQWLFFRQEPYRVDPTSWRAQWLDFFGDATKALRKAAANDLKNSFLHGRRASDILYGR